MYMYLYSYKHKNNKIEMVSRNGSTKEYGDRSSSQENSRQGTPYTLFLSNRFSMKNLGMHLVYYFPGYYCSCLHTFLHYHPYLFNILLLLPICT